MILQPRVVGRTSCRFQAPFEWSEDLPGLDTVEQALFLPPLPAMPGLRPDINGRGGLFYRHGVPVPAAATLRRGGRHALEPARYAEAVRRADEEVLYLGFLMPQYGHALLEGMARAWALDRLGWQGRLLVHTHDPDLLQTPNGRFLVEMLEVFGICPSRILVPVEPTEFLRVHVPWPAFSFSGKAHRCFTAPYRRAAERWAGDVVPCGAPLYLSKTRAELSGPVGEARLVQELEKAGCVIAHPQELSIRDQIRLVNRHKLMAGPIGSPMHNHLFSLSPVTVTALWAEQSYWDILAMTTAAANRPLNLISCAGRAGLGNDWDMDVDAALAHLRSEGIMDAPPPRTSLLSAVSTGHGQLGWRVTLAACLRRGPLAALRERRDALEILSSGLFDAAHYLRAFPDVAAAGIPAVIHYLRHGAREGRNPGPLFDGGRYLGDNPDVGAAGANPLLHYLRHGRREGRPT